MDAAGSAILALTSEAIRTAGIWAFARQCPPCSCQCTPSLACPGGSAYSSATQEVGQVSPFAWAASGLILGLALVPLIQAGIRRLLPDTPGRSGELQAQARSQLAALGYGGSHHGGVYRG